MAQTATKPVEAAPEPAVEQPADRPAMWEMLTLHIPEGLKLTDGLLEQLGDLNPQWKVERGHYGELVLTMASGGPSWWICSELCGEVRHWANHGGGGLAAGPDAGFNVIDPQGGEPMRNPDISWISAEQFEAMGGALQLEGFWNVCPAFVVEVRSPRDSLAAQRRRMADWMRFGAQLGWLVDVQGRSVWVYRPGEEPERVERPAVVGGESVLEGFAFDFTPVWEMLDQAPEARQTA